MNETIKDYFVELAENQIVIRKSGETIKAIDVSPIDAIERFKAIVAKIKALK